MTHLPTNTTPIKASYVCSYNTCMYIHPPVEYESMQLCSLVHTFLSMPSSSFPSNTAKHTTGNKYLINWLNYTLFLIYI